MSKYYDFVCRFFWNADWRQRTKRMRRHDNASEAFSEFWR